MRKKDLRWKLIAAALPLMLSSSILAADVQAAVPYEGYNYDYYNKRVASPVAYTPDRVVTGQTVGTKAFNQPEDIFVTSDNMIYVLDTGNNRIVILNDKYEFVKEITSFTYKGKEDTFKGPKGIFVSNSKEIYVADTGNHRVVKLNEDGVSDLMIVKPTSEMFTKDYVFDPVKIVVDQAERIYVIAQRVFDGIMEFDNDGNFRDYFGANKVTYNPMDLLWKKLSTKAQREKMVKFIPTEYTNFDMDENGFIYTTTADRFTDTPMKRLNPTGTDVLRREGFANPRGDLKYKFTEGPSMLSDIDVSDGLYSGLDNLRGRIFTYDTDGNLLYIFGRLGEREGTAQYAQAIERVGDDMLVLDKPLNRFTVYKLSNFGKLVNQAVRLHYHGDDAASSEVWKQVLELDANFDIAYAGISKADLRQGDNKDAVKYAELGMNRNYYSKAYQRFRKEVLKGSLGDIMGWGLLAIVLLTGFVQYRKFKRRRGMTRVH